MIRLLVVGKDKFTYNRTAVLLAGLEANPEVELNVHTLHTKSRAAGKALLDLSKSYDYILVPAFRHTDMPFVKRWSSVPIIFDPLISKYMTKVIDYKQYWKFYKYFIDYRIFRLADLLIADTNVHRDTYRRIFGIPFAKSITIPVGVNTDFPSIDISQLSDSHPISKKFIVGFYGSFVPLQGTSVIIEAAKKMREYTDITIRLIGTGHEYKNVVDTIDKKGLDNVELVGWVDQENLKREIDQFDICLGIFGSSPKAHSVVPNKVCHYAALGKPIITKDTAGIREVFDESSAALIAGDAQSLVDAILRLKNNPTSRRELGQNSYQVIQSKYTHHHIAQLLVDRLLEGVK
jgi:glycosyltransferase involved in cell wall biosynthesis